MSFLRPFKSNGEAVAVIIQIARLQRISCVALYFQTHREIESRIRKDPMQFLRLFHGALRVAAAQSMPRESL